jgi:hypothetical protein
MCACKNFVLTSFLVIPLLSAPPVFSHSQTFSGLPRAMDDLEKCRETATGPFAAAPGKPVKEGEMSPFASAERPEAIRDAIKSCEQLLAKEQSSEIAWKDEAVRPLMWSPDLPTSKVAPRVQPVNEGGLKDIGNAATNISRAREAVYEILDGENACSAWFRRTDPRVAATFLSLAFSVDEDGSKRVVKERNDSGIWIEHGPYIARTHEGTGPGTTVTINGNGAFFRTRGDVHKIEWTGSVGNDTGSWRHLHVGPFDGGTLEAQIVTLLHELAHVIAAVPSDDWSAGGFARSQENTELILRHCRGETGATARKKRLLAKLGGNL